jgi:hypothetical protein
MGRVKLRKGRDERKGFKMVHWVTQLLNDDWCRWLADYDESHKQATV